MKSVFNNVSNKWNHKRWDYNKWSYSKWDYSKWGHKKVGVSVKPDTSAYPVTVLFCPARKRPYRQERRMSKVQPIRQFWRDQYPAVNTAFAPAGIDALSKKRAGTYS